MIRHERIQADIAAIADCTQSPGHGATRPTFGEAWARARAYVLDQARAAGAQVRIDPAGNAHARPAALGWDAQAWLVGSHLDSVPHGGDYDGVAGVVLGLELLRSAAEDGLPAPPIELIDFAEEEGPTFGRGMLGSLALVGGVSADELAQLRNDAGESYLDAGRPHGVDPEQLPVDRAWLTRCHGLIELHAEQGPGLWDRDQRLAVVSGIAGRRQYTATVTGQANHAGATTMTDRRDALAGAAQMLLALEALAPDISSDAVITVGRLNAEPNALNVIPGRVTFTIDFRAPTDEQLARGDADLAAALQALADQRGLGLELQPTESLPAVPMNRALVNALHQTAGAHLPTAVSGALHDAAILANALPTAMLFVPSRGGISHNPDEFSRTEDLAAAAEVVERFVRRATLEQINTGDQAAFVAAIGPCYEHSPWIAERAWGQHPFADINALAAALAQAVDAASADEQLALIRAHPDLVGRLAATESLTAESTREQHAAGLNTLTPEQAAQLAEHNAAYQARFGFPFVICARENRIDAILSALPQRLQNDPDTERATALNQIHRIARLRLDDAVHTPLAR